MIGSRAKPHKCPDKIRLKKYGGGGYAELLNCIFPRLLEKGLTKEQLDLLMIENPKRLLM